MRAARTKKIALRCACAVTAALSCQSRGASREVATGASLTALVAPRGGEADSIASLVDGRIDPDGWYCSHRATPQRYEVMLSEGVAVPIRAVGFVAGNLGPDGVGPVRVRVQTGHGPAARGEDFRAEVRGRNDALLVVELPEPVRGDHVVLSLLRRSRYSTAMCLAEIVVFPVEGAARVPGDAVVVRGVPAPPEPAATRPTTPPGGGDAGAPSDGGAVGSAAAAVDAGTAADASADAAPAPARD